MNFSRIFFLIVLIVAGTSTFAAGMDRDAEILFRQARTTIDADSAAVLYKQVVEMFPRDSVAAWSLLRLAQYSSVRGAQANMEAYVIRLREQFPHSPARMEAASLMAERRDEQEIIPEKKSSGRHDQNSIPKKSEGAATLPQTTTPSNQTSAASDTNTIYGVQLGAFAVKANAARMQTLAGKKFPVDVIERKRDAGSLFVVIAGNFSSKSAAESALLTLEKITGVRGVIVAR